MTDHFHESTSGDWGGVPAAAGVAAAAGVTTPAVRNGSAVRDRPAAEPALAELVPDWSLQTAIEFAAIAVRRHFWTGVLIGLGVLIATAAYLSLAPRQYLSTAKLYVRLGRESVTLDPTATTGKTLPIAESRENQINSVLEIISSENIYAAVVDQLGPDVVLGLADVPAEAGGAAAVEPVEHAAMHSAAYRKAVELLQKKIDLEAVKRSNVIWVSAEMSDPLLAQRTLQTFLDAAEELYLANTRSDGTVALFEQESVKVATEYTEQARQLAAIKSRIGVSSIEDRRKTLQQQLSESERAIDQAEARLVKSEAMVDALAESLRDLDQYEMALTSNQPQDARGQAERDVSRLELKEKELLATYTQRHPEVRRVREQIATARALLAAAKPPEQKTATTSPVWRQLEQTRQQELANIRGTKSELTSLTSSRELVKRRLSELNDAEGDIASREKMLEVLRKQQVDYAEKLQQARLDEVMTAQSLSDISVPQPATYQPKAIAPKKRLIAAAGGVFALGLALLAMLGLEYWDRHRSHWTSLLAPAA